MPPATLHSPAVGEETLLPLREGEPAQPRDDSHMLLMARADGDAAVLEFVAATDETNIEDEMAVLQDRPGALPGRGGGVLTAAAALRLLRSPTINSTTPTW